MSTMEKRIEKLESNFSEMQKLLYEVLASVKSISNSIDRAINIEEKVIVLDERQKVVQEKISKCERKREIMEKEIATVKNKLAYYSGAILIISILVPYILNVLFH